jgi:hypothetical protein
MNITFESLPRGNPAATSSQTSRDVAAGTKFKSAGAPIAAGEPAAANPPPIRAAAGALSNLHARSHADAPAVAYQPVAPRANPHVIAGNEYSSAFSNPAYAFLKRSQILQTLIDIGALALLLLFVSFAAVVIGGAPLILLLVGVH